MNDKMTIAHTDKHRHIHICGQTLADKGRQRQPQTDKDRQTKTDRQRQTDKDRGTQRTKSFTNR